MTARVNGDRLWSSLMEMAEIGATEKGGVARLALTDLDRKGRDLFVAWCQEAGCSITIDNMGNIFATRPGRDVSALPIAAGSHLDSQPTGGKFDGVYGVLAGLEVIRSLNDNDIETVAPVEVVVWTNEEGARFAPAMVASGVFGGAFSSEYGLSREDLDGKTIGEELKRIGYAGDEQVGHHKLGAHIEAHIEQGPILEDENKTIGVVTGVQGIRWYDVVLTGTETHAGPNPMHLRRDPVRVLPQLLQSIFKIALDLAPDARATIGELQAHPGSRNTVPGSVRMTVDLRHPDAEILAAMDKAMRQAVLESNTSEIAITVEEIWVSEPVQFEENVIAAIRGATRDLGFSSRDIVSGAGHDSVYVARVAPTAMIFIPCEGGVSHNEAELATREDVAAGADVLLKAVLELAGTG